MATQTTNHRATMNHNGKKINEALTALAESAREKQEEIQKGLQRFQKQAQKTIQQGQTRVRQSATAVDKNVRKNPWAVIGGVAASALLLGFIAGKLKRKA